MTQLQLSRRAFVATGIGIGLGAALPSVQAARNEEPSADVLIVGAGFAGLTAAVIAARGGAKVRIIDKRKWFGGDGVLSSGILYASKTSHHEKSGIVEGVSKDDFWEYWTANNARTADGSHTKSNPKVMRTTCDRAADVIDFITSYGIEFNPVLAAKPFQLSTPSGSMTKFVQGMLKELEGKGIKPERNVRATKLLMKGDAVIGVETFDDKQKTRNYFAKTVVLATGGYLDSDYLFERYKPYWAKVTASIGKLGEKRVKDHTGDGILMGKAIGVGLEDMEATPGLNARTPLGVPFTSWTLFDVEPAYLVTAAGNRIIDEHKNRYIGCCLELLKRGEKQGFAIFGHPTFVGPNKKRFKFESAIEKGAVFKADTPEELARKAGIDPQGLKKTIEHINRDAAKGVDSEFGRTDKVFKPLVPPFYATHAARPVRYATEGGLETNERFQALRLTDDKPVPGLFVIGVSAGEITLHLSDVIASGLIAGECLAKG